MFEINMEFAYLADKEYRQVNFKMATFLLDILK